MTEKPGKRSRLLRRLAITGAIVAVLLVVAWVCRRPILTGLASAWVVDQPVEKADAIAVLGGGAQYRAFAAAQLFHDGIAPKVLVMKVGLDPADDPKLGSRETDLIRRVLLHERVPADALVTVGDGVTSTREEALAIRDWAIKSGARRVVIPTDLFHSRRANRLFKKVFASSGVDVRVHAVPPVEYRLDDWWQHDEGVIAFHNELVKSVLYAARY